MLIRNRSHRSHLLTRGACGRRHWEGQSTSAARVRSYDATRRRQARAGSRSLSRRLRGTPDVRLAARDVRRRAAHTSAPRSTQSGAARRQARVGQIPSSPDWRQAAGNSVPARKQQEHARRIKSVQEAPRRPWDCCAVGPGAQDRPITAIQIKPIPGRWIGSPRANRPDTAYRSDQSDPITRKIQLRERGEAKQPTEENSCKHFRLTTLPRIAI
jgi:hypothetical protein